jgi:hypothetical protein
MRYTYFAFLIAILLSAPLITGCAGGKKKEEAPKYETPEKQSNPKGLKQPQLPEAPP